MCRARHAASAAGLIALTLSPATVIVPRVGRSSPAMRFNSVDLPLPDGPINAVKLRSAKSSVRSSKTSMTWVSRWNDLWTLRSSTRAMGTIGTVKGEG